jgi:hypothetical protein
MLHCCNTAWENKSSRQPNDSALTAWLLLMHENLKRLLPQSLVHAHLLDLCCQVDASRHNLLSQQAAHCTGSNAGQSKQRSAPNVLCSNGLPSAEMCLPPDLDGEVKGVL